MAPLGFPPPPFLFFLGWGEGVGRREERGELGYVIKKLRQIFRGGPGVCPPGNILNFGSLKRHFLHFEGTFEQNIKVLNHIFNTVNKGVNR